MGFGSNGINYDAHRPGYLAEAVQIIANNVNTAASLPGMDVHYNILELGAGTGKLTEQLVKILPSNVKYLATDPSKNFVDTLAAKDLGVNIAVASADSIPLPDCSVQTVICAQCFHWFADMPNLESIRRVMVPGGKLVLIWNVNNFEDSWMKLYGEQRMRVIKKVGGSLTYLVNTGEWRRDIDACSLFSLASYQNLPGNHVVGDIEKILSNISTISAYNMLPDEERKAVLGEMREVITNWPGIDVQNLTMLMSTLLVTYEAI
ncbi:methyltransferase [Plakobranchus ocellatus]|uniref:Methyltransferase n=1 Tax=Plakobranchus ocellatus TaxID=259542 RepID=A0AAV3Y743_9GAST|nr:methyltransferase [Plakobranchus ocellatus]